MNTERWQRVGDIFERLLDVPEAEREKQLSNLCGDDEQLRGIVVSMLDSHESPRFSDASLSTLRDTSQAAAAALLRGESPPRDSETEGTRIGPWRLARRIGAGGMGVVWLAERADGQFKQRAALKLIKRGMDSEAVLARFLRERQILARLEHRNIAHLLDGGIAPDGRPYFAMEYVEGLPLLAYCNEHHLKLEERLRLFLQVCSALRFAHAQHVVHRDIKPSNILVTADGSVKLLDFGIAKLLQGDDELTSTLTGTQREQPMTPAYAAPEQIAGGEVSEATDVYALGVVFYELLSGRRPHDFSAAADAHDVLKIILATDPVAPGRLKLASSPVPLKRLRGDLDTIALTALRQMPARRYSSVAAFAADIENYLAGRPIAAKRDHVFYRAFKFARRHRTGLAAIVVVSMIAILAGLVVYNERQMRSVASRDASIAIADFNNLAQNKEFGWIGAALRPMMGNELAQGSKLHALPDELVREGSAGLTPPTAGGYSRADLAVLRKRLGADYVLSGSYLVSAGAADVKLRLDLAMQDTRDGTTVANVMQTGPSEDLLTLVQKAGGDLRDQLGFSKIDAETKKQVAQAQPPSTDVARHVGLALDALRRYEPARAKDELIETVVAAPGYALGYLYLSQAWHLMGYEEKALASAQQAAARSANLPELQRSSIAREVAIHTKEWKQAIELDRKLLALEPGNSERYLALAQDLREAGQLDESDKTIVEWRQLPGNSGDPRMDLEASENANYRGDQEAALKLAQQALEKARKSDASGLQGLAKLKMARALNSLGRNEQIENLLKEAIADFRKAENPSGEARAHQLMGAFRDRLNQVPDALTEFQSALEIFQRIGNRIGISDIYFNQQRILWRHGDRDAAIAVARRTLEIGEETGDLRTEATAAISLASMHMDESLSDSVMQELRNAIDLSERSGFRSLLLFAQQNYIGALRLRGDLGQARSECVGAEKGAKSLNQPYYSILVGLRCAGVALDSGEVDAAITRFNEVRTIAEAQSDRAHLAEVEMNLAQIDLGREDNAHACDRLELANDAYASMESATGQANAQALLASCRAAQHQEVPSKTALARARELRSSVTSLSEVFLADLVLAKMQPSDRAAAALHALADSTRQSQWLAYSLEAQLEEWRVLDKTRDPGAKAVRATLEATAKEKQFNWVLARLHANTPTLP